MFFRRVRPYKFINAGVSFRPDIISRRSNFQKEVRLGDTLKMDLQLIKSRKDFSRWSIKHQVIKNENIIAATITVDGAWINTELRKLATPPMQVINVFDQMPRAAEFEWH